MVKYRTGLHLQWPQPEAPTSNVNNVYQEASQTAGGNINLAETEPYQENVEDLDQLKNEEILVEIHRTNLKNDVNNAFKSVKINLKLKFKIYNPTGKLEEGIRIGVDRDAYSSVWLELMDSIFVGSNERVIYVRHELYFEGWEAFHGFTSCFYFSIQLSRAFEMFCLFGHAPNDSLMQLFLQYLSRTEKEVAQTALSGQKLFYLFIYLFLLIYFFEVFNLPHFNEVSLLCRRIDLSVLSVALDPPDKMYILLGELSIFIRICIT